MKKLSVLLVAVFRSIAFKQKKLYHIINKCQIFFIIFLNFYNTVCRAITVIKIWRRGWDLNPRILSYRRFSRPVHSAALPPLH